MPFDWNKFQIIKPSAVTVSLLAEVQTAFADYMAINAAVIAEILMSYYAEHPVEFALRYFDPVARAVEQWALPFDWKAIELTDFTYAASSNKLIEDDKKHAVAATHTLTSGALRFTYSLAWNSNVWVMVLCVEPMTPTELLLQSGS